MSLRVADLYGHVTVQGPPKLGLRRFGVPPGGPFDPRRVERLNAWLGNPLDQPVLELALASGRLEISEDALFAWDGPPARVLLNGRHLRPLEARLAAAGDTVQFGPPEQGCRIWFGFSGSLAPVGRHLKRGDVLPFLSVRQDGPSGRWSPDRVEGGPLTLRLVASGDGLRLEGTSFEVTADSNRVGVRLKGDQPGHTIELPSRPQTPGTLQVAPDGTLLLFGPDGPTIGGYPIAGVIARVDLPKVAQLRPGDHVHFEEIDLEQAREALARELARHEEELRRIKVARAVLATSPSA